MLDTGYKRLLRQQRETREKLRDSYIPFCEAHYRLMVARSGKYGKFWSCPAKNADGSWCQFRFKGPKPE